MSETAVTDETTTDEVESETRDVGFVYAHGLDHPLLAAGP